MGGEGNPTVRGYILDELEVGQTAEIVRTVTAEQIEQFAEASTDYNPVHMDEAYARTTAFRGRIATACCPASFVSAVVGHPAPGAGALYLEQTWLRQAHPHRRSGTAACASRASTRTPPAWCWRPRAL
jgi:acyl dehydratase